MRISLAFYSLNSEMLSCFWPASSLRWSWKSSDSWSNPVCRSLEGRRARSHNPQSCSAGQSLIAEWTPGPCAHSTFVPEEASFAQEVSWSVFFLSSPHCSYFLRMVTQIWEWDSYDYNQKSQSADPICFSGQEQVTPDDVEDLIPVRKYFLGNLAHGVAKYNPKTWK